MPKTSKITPFFLMLVAFLTFSFQGRAIPMFGDEEKKPIKPVTSLEQFQELTEQQRRERNLASTRTDLNGGDEEKNADQVTRGIVPLAVEHSEQDDQEKEKRDAFFSLEDFRTALQALPAAQRFVITDGNIQSGNVTAGNRNENLAIIAALKDALE